MSRRKENLYHLYHGIKQRCYNPNNPRYKNYGGKGITMCEEWLLDYDSFKEWSITHGYKNGLSIDRLDESKGYSPENCEWVTISENSRRGNFGKHKNKTKLKNLIAISPSGEVISITNIAKFCRDYGLNYSNVNAAFRGRSPSKTKYGWEFISNKTISK